MRRDANNASFDPAISAYGRCVTFGSDASILVAGDTKSHYDVFVRASPQPTVTAVAPATLTRGTTASITVTGSGFIDDAVLVIDGTGITLSNVTVAAGATVGTRNVFVEHLGTGPGTLVAIALCAGCATID